MLLIQPFLGLAHHYGFRTTHKRSVWTYIHVWYGRILILLGMVNGGLGLQLADNSRGGKIVYGVIAGLTGGVYFVFLVAFEMRVSKLGRKTSTARCGQVVGNKSKSPRALKEASGV
jgi:hypothetical protein